MFRFEVPNMKCGGCAGTVKMALLSIDPLARIETNPPARSVSIDSNKSEKDLRAVLAEAGYPASEDAPQQGAT